MATDKIKKAITWIRKTLEITERTSTPSSIADRIQPALDVLGWDRYEEIQSENVGQADANTVATTVVPTGIMRLFIACSGETNDPLNAFTHWIEMIPSATGNAVALTPPVTLPVSTVIIRAGGLPKPVLVPPGGSLRARCTPSTAGGLVLRVRAIFVDVEIGEYIKSL